MTKTLQILVIDDDLARQNWFATKFEHFKNLKVEYDQAFNDLQAFECLQDKVYDVVFFDHDLGIGKNGSEIANEILWNECGLYKAPKTAWIQSENFTGALNIGSKFRSFDPKFKVIECGFSSIMRSERHGPGWFEGNIKDLCHVKNEKCLSGFSVSDSQVSINFISPDDFDESVMDDFCKDFGQKVISVEGDNDSATLWFEMAPGIPEEDADRAYEWFAKRRN